jgi:hypothetical protein
MDERLLILDHWQATDSSARPIDWAAVYRRLAVFAAGFAGFVPPIIDGVSLEDMPGETLLSFLESTDALGWVAERGDLGTFLCGVLKNKLFTRLRRQWRNSGSLDDPGFQPGSTMLAADHGRVAEAESFISRLKRLVKGDEELERFVDAALMYEGGNDVNKQMGGELGERPARVSSIRKRLLRRVSGGSI